MISKYFFIFSKRVFVEKSEKVERYTVFRLGLEYILIINEVRMNYYKKMCILRQVKQGFSGDGKPLSGLIKIEQYGKNLAVEVSIINFAPLSSGEYYCLLSDGKRKTEMLKLRGKSIFNLLSDLDISNGFCGIICFVKNEVIPIAYGINGNGSYDWKSILNTTLPPVFPRAEEENAISKKESVPLTYNDEEVSENNYFEEEENARKQFNQTQQNASTQSSTEKQTAKTGADETENGDAQSVRKPFQVNPDGYYLSVKGEIDDLFSKYPKDDTLCNAFSCSEWARVKGTKKHPEYLVGIVYEEGKAQYICYALAAKAGTPPPEEIKNVCNFVPISAFQEQEGFFVIFQSAASGECIKPERG